VKANHQGAAEFATTENNHITH